MATKRKADELGSKAAGKQKLQPEYEADPTIDEDFTSVEAALGLLDDEADDDDNLEVAADDLVDVLDGDSEAFGDEALGLVADDAAGYDESDAEPDDEADDESVAETLPFDAGQLEAEDVDLSSLHDAELTMPEARRAAQLLAANGSLSMVRCSGREMSVGSLADDDELEWDSEEYGDVEAIILAELLKPNTVVKRLDLARNAIGDAGACALAAMLAENTCLEYLNLECCTFGERGGVAFVAALAKNSTLSYLNLKENSLPGSTQQDLRDAWAKGRQGIGLHI